MLWYFKLDDSLLLMGNVEVHHSGPCLHPDYLLLAVGCSSKCMNLAMYILGGFAKGLVSGSTVDIGLFRPSRTLCLDVLAC